MCTNNEIKSEVEASQRKIRLFKEILAASYEADKVVVTEDPEDGDLTITEPDQSNCMYHAFAILQMAELLELSALVRIGNEGLEIIIS